MWVSRQEMVGVGRFPPGRLLTGRRRQGIRSLIPAPLGASAQPCSERDGETLPLRQRTPIPRPHLPQFHRKGLGYWPRSAMPRDSAIRPSLGASLFDFADRRFAAADRRSASGGAESLRAANRVTAFARLLGCIAVLGHRRDRLHTRPNNLALGMEASVLGGELAFVRAEI